MRKCSYVCDAGDAATQGLVMLLSTADMVCRYGHAVGTIHPLSISFDACFRLTHLRSAKGHPSDALFATEYFSMTESVITSQAGTSTTDCSEFRAIRNALSKSKRDMFDRNAVCGAVCARHGIPVPGTFGDINEGEKFEYADNALRELLARDVPRKTFIYDIVCQYVKRVKDVR